MTLSNGSVTEETIIYQNDKSRRIYYTKSDDQAVSGYLATTYVDDLCGTRCMLDVSSAFDVSDRLGRAAAGDRFGAVYLAMFEGYRRFFADQR